MLARRPTPDTDCSVMVKSGGVAMKEAVPIGFQNSNMCMDEKDFCLCMVQRGYFRHSVLFDPFGEGYRLEKSSPKYFG